MCEDIIKGGFTTLLKRPERITGVNTQLFDLVRETKSFELSLDYKYDSTTFPVQYGSRELFVLNDFVFVFIT